MTAALRILVIGYGNPGRLDDGLGPAFADALEALDLPDVTCDADYQLSVEHAELVAAHDVVVLVDAALDGPAPFSIRTIEPQTELSFSTHSVSPAALLGLARDLFGHCPRGYLLGIRGYEFNEFGERLSQPARHNLSAAVSFFAGLVRERRLPASPAVGAPNGVAATSGSQQ